MNGNKKNMSVPSVPNLVGNSENCCGCTACQQVCLVQAIKMTADREGFLYPDIDESKCIRCGRCINVCTFKQEQRVRGYLKDNGKAVSMEISEEPAVYAVKHKDEKIRAASRSGGIFTALSDAVLRENGVVYGCILTDKFNAVHFRADNAQDRDKMRGSKYIQSNMNTVMKQVRTDLNNGRKVLFSGTSCQVAGLRKYLGKPYDNLLCVDILCYGVPSSLVWKKFLAWNEKKKGQKIVGVNFRNKRDFGWSAHKETLYFSDNTHVNSEVFKRLFSSGIILRPSCYKCPYKSTHHPSDITIADYWGIDKAAPNFSDNKGVSLVLVNTPKGEKYFSQVQNELTFKSTKLEDSLQPVLKAPCPKPENRPQFWKDFYEKPFGFIVRKYGTPSLYRRLRAVLGKVKRKIKKILSH